MLRAYRLIITNNSYAPENLWETEQPYIDNLSRSARTFGHQIKQRFFLNEKALNWENLRIWHTDYKPKPAHEDVPNWQAYLEWYRQLVVETLEIADEAGAGKHDKDGMGETRRKGDMMTEQHSTGLFWSPDRARSAES